MRQNCDIPAKYQKTQGLVISRYGVTLYYQSTNAWIHSLGLLSLMLQALFTISISLCQFHECVVR